MTVAARGAQEPSSDPLPSGGDGEPGLEPRHVPQQRPGAPGGKRDANRRRRTKDIADAGLRLFLQRGIEDVTIDEIVREAGVAKGSFYRYFEDKSDLVAAIFSPYEPLIEEAFAACADALRAATNRDELFAAYQGLAAALTVVLLSAPDVFVRYLQENRAPGVGARRPVRELAGRIDARAIELTHVAHTHGLLRPIDPRVSARAVVGAVEKLLHAVLAGHDVGEPTEIPGQLIAMILSGLRGE